MTKDNISKFNKMAMKSSAFDTSATSVNFKKDALEAAAKIVDYHIEQDNHFSELVDILKMGGELPTVSGLNDQDYPGISELGGGLRSLTQLNVVKKIPLPSELVEQFSLMQSCCQMGLFPEIGRAWLTIDSNIFLWSFEDGSDLAYYDGVSEAISCVGLVKPKAGIFQNFIHFLLCLTTPVEIIILGVNFSRQNENSPPFEEMHLLPQPLFSIPTDNTFMFAFQGSDDGRIFFGGKDGCIYEIVYQADDGWFTKRYRKVNHSSGPLSLLVPQFLQNAFCEDDGVAQIVIDNSKHILYARSEKGSIQVFDLGSDGKQMSKVVTLHHHSITNIAATIAKTVDRKNFYPIISITPVEASESHHVDLVAVTQAGVRLFFATNVSTGFRPSTLALLHVRLPPGFSANASIVRPSNVHMAFYKKGLLLMASSETDDQDVLFAASNDSFVFHSSLIETHAAVSLDGRTWALSEIPTSFAPKQIAQSNLSVPPVDPPLLVAQHLQMPRMFALLSTQGSCIVTKPRPVDLLFKLLIENNGPDCEAVKAFFRLHKESQACAMCLVLACCQSPQEKQVSEWATRAFFVYGGDPGVNYNPVSGASTFDSPLSFTRSLNAKPPVWTSTPAQGDEGVIGVNPHIPPASQFSNVYSPVRSIMDSTQGASILSQQLTAPTVSANVETFFSGKHNGLFLYFSRLIRYLWSLKLVSDKSSAVQESDISVFSSNITSEDLAVFLQHLSALRDFLQHSHPFFGAVINTSTAPQFSSQLSGRVHGPHEASSLQPGMQKRIQTDAELQERTSLLNLEQLVNYTCEVLGLWKVLCDHQFSSLMLFLPEGQKESLKTMSFRELIIDGKELCSVLAMAVINFYLEDNASTNAISQRLREVCPSIYKIEDATVSKIQEITLNAKNIVNPVDREKELFEALKLCKKISPNFNLQSICELFREANFYHGIVDLCLCTAKGIDPQGLALHYYNSGEPPNDQQGMHVFTNRMNCYKSVIDSLNELLSQSLSHPQSPNVPKTPGPPVNRQQDALTPAEAKKYSELVFEMALKTDDELFHAALYDWLIDNNKTDMLLSIRSHFLENYLKRQTTMHSENLGYLDLLWKFYEKNQNYSAAARVLAKLADKHGVELSLQQRLEYLSRAIMCIKSSEMRISAGGEGEFLHELEEKMEVARIQLHILETLQQKSDRSLQDVIARLNSNFKDITELYEDFAVPYDLPESKLAIIHCAGHYDPSLIESLWQSIIDKELINTCGNLPETRVKLLQQKIQSVSQAYISSEKYFPIDFIVKYLEFKTCTLNFSVKWVLQTFISLSVPLVELLHIYHKLYRTKDPCWQTAKRPLHLLQVLSSLIAESLENPSLVPFNERRAFVTFCLDVIAGYLVDLQAMNTTDPTVPSLIKEFKSIQHRLERML